MSVTTLWIIVLCLLGVISGLVFNRHDLLLVDLGYVIGNIVMFVCIYFVNDKKTG